MTPQHAPISPAFAPLNPVPHAPLPSYPTPQGAGVVAWVCATSIGTVIALCCLAASYLGSVGVSSLVASVGGGQ